MMMKTKDVGRPITARLVLLLVLLGAWACPQATQAKVRIRKLRIPTANDVRKKAAELDRKRLKEQKKLEERARELNRQRAEAQRRLETKLQEARKKVRETTTYSSNKEEVLTGLRSGNWQVALGKEIDFKEYKVFAGAVVASVATQNPGPVMVYVKYMIEATKAEIMKNLDNEAQKTLGNIEMQLIAALDRAIKTGKITELKFGGLDVRIGVASFNNWKKVSGHYPKIDRGSISMEYKEARTSLPNTHVPYVAYRLRIATR